MEKQRTPQIHLASSSVRRQALLDQIGIGYTLIAIDMPEIIGRDETPTDFVQRMAVSKARLGLAQCGTANSLPVLAADTIVTLDDRIIMGKPIDEADAHRMLSALSGAWHQVLTAVTLAHDRYETRLSVSNVRFRKISDTEKRAYWLSGEPRDKAGGYAIQGLGATFVEHLDGSFSGVMGLPLYETALLLNTFGINTLAIE